MSLSARLDDLADLRRERSPGGEPSGGGADSTTVAARLHELFDVLWEHRIESTPELATYLGEPGPTHRWSDLSLEAIDRRKDDAAAAVEALRTFEREEDLSSLDETDRTSLRLAIHDHEQLVVDGRFPQELLAATTMSGAHIEVPQVIGLMPARTLGDLDDVVARISGISVLVDQTISLLDEGRKAGVTIPRVVADQLAPSIEALVAGPVASSPLLSPFESRPEGATQSDFDDIKAEAVDAAESAMSAFRRLAQYLETAYVPACRESIALSALPDGAEWYAALVRRETTTDLTPDDIHKIGLDEVARIRAEMEQVIETTGFSKAGGSFATAQERFAAFSEFLRTDDRFYFETPGELLSSYRDMAKRADAELPRLFGVLPRLPYGVKAVPDHEAPTAPVAFYLPGSIELGRPGWFCANTYDLRARPSYDMEATCLHEGVPGHHLQIAIAAELEGLPKFRSKSWNYTAFVEGWGLYAESLGTEMGFYADPYSRFGQLASELWRAIRLVVDTGMHALGWSRDQSIEYCRVSSTAPLHDITAEIDRYLSIPGQALAYKVGELTIQRLRRDAAAALGERFDLRRFHDMMLGAGPLPLAVLEERCRSWCEVD